MKNNRKLIQYGLICLILLTVVLKIQNTIVGSAVKANAKSGNEVAAENETNQISENDMKQEAAGMVEDGSAYTIMGDTEVDEAQMVAYFHSSGHTYPSEGLGAGGAPTIEDYCRMYLEEAEKEGVRAEIPYVQSLKETGWLQFEGVCDISQYNFAGMGATGGDVAGESYADVRTGIRAQIQHLKAYATADPLTEACVDTRYDLVTKASAPYVEWLGQQENPEGYGWATDPGYGLSIKEMIQSLKNS